MNQDPNSQRPTDPLTAQDAAELFSQIERLRTEVIKKLQETGGRLAVLHRHDIDILETLARIEAGLSDSRLTRLEVDLREAELELQRAESDKEKAEERLRLKQDVKDRVGSTQERIQELTTTAYNRLEEQRKKAREERINDVKFSALKAIVISFAVSGSIGVAGFIWFLIQLYLNRGGP